MSTLVMAAIPFAIEKTNNWLWKLGFFVFGLGLATLNYTLAHETVGKLRDFTAAPATATAAKRAALNSRIERARTAASQLPQLPQTSAAEVSAAEQAVQFAEQAKAQECGKVGDNCRLRIYDLNAAIEKRGKVLAARSATEKREGYEATIEEASHEVEALGPL
jgi:hypothetical protein